MQISRFLTEGTFGVFPLTYFYLPKSAREYLLSQSVETHYLRSGNVSVDPICPQPRSASLTAPNGPAQQRLLRAILTETQLEPRPSPESVRSIRKLSRIRLNYTKLTELYSIILN